VTSTDPADKPEEPGLEDPALEADPAAPESAAADPAAPESDAPAPETRPTSGLAPEADPASAAGAADAAPQVPTSEPTTDSTPAAADLGSHTETDAPSESAEPSTPPEPNPPPHPPRRHHARRVRRRDASPRPLRGTVDDIEATLRARLGLRPKHEVIDPRVRLMAWLLPIAMGLFAALLRVPRLGIPTRLAFDETYYVKEAFSLLTLGYEGEWEGDDANDRFKVGDFGALTSDPDYVVHPPLGKWLIAIGMRMFGPEDPASWRVSSVVAGILLVVLVTALATRIFRSPLLGGVAGLLMAVDGVALTASRIGLLDVFLALFVLVGTMLAVRDRTVTRSRLARRAAEQIAASPDGLLPGRFAPSVGMRWWLIAAGVAIGASCGIKWSGIYAAAVIGVMVFVWDTAARRAVGARSPLVDGVVRGGIPAFLALVPTVLVTYVLAWASWFRSTDAFHRTWAADQIAAGESTGFPTWLPDSLVSWLDYHRMMMEFHTGLMNPHESQSHPLLWLLQLRPTLFYRAGGTERETLGVCGDDTCIAGVTSIGNPLLWWLAVVGLGIVIYGAVRLRDWRAWLILSGYIGMWLPWVVLYNQRTIFQFYGIAFTAFVVLALTYGLGWILGILRPPTDAPVPRGEPRDGDADRWWHTRLHFGRPVPVDAPARAGTGPVEAGTASTTAGTAPPDDDTQSPDDVATDSGRLPLARVLTAEDGRYAMDRPGWWTLAIVLASILAVSAWFYPAWTAWNLSDLAWGLRNWAG
jgi:4-amino-4-deoxy-L-arabinose transferase-like glycosyltransferase